MVIDFKDLVDKYEENLVSKLRGFGEEDFLKFWVPDSEKLKSLFNLIDALFESNTLKARVINLNLKFNEIKNLENLYGIAIRHMDTNELIINIDTQKYLEFLKKQKSYFKKIKSSPNKNISELEPINFDETIGKEYDEVLNKIDKLNFNREPDKKNYTCHQNYLLELSDNLKLYYFVNKTNGIVEIAYHNSEKIIKKSILLDLLCSQIINKNIEEVADHGVIYLVFFLRSKMKKKDNFGIFLPRNSGGIFNLFEENLRLSREDFFQMEKVDRNSINREYRIVSNEWSNLNFDEQKSKVDDILEKHVFRNLNINSSDIILNRVIQGNRLEFLISNNLKGDFEDTKLFKIEQILKEKIDSSIELFSIEEKDSNKLRITNAPKTI